MDNLDFRGMNCPQPVMETKKYLDAHPDTTGVSVRVDNKAASENVSRFLNSRNFSIQVTEVDNTYYVTGNKSGDCAECEVTVDEPKDRNTLIMFTHNTMGTGNVDLGEKLMLNFIKTLPEIIDSLWRLVFVNQGVFLAVEASQTYPILKDIEEKGVSILVCGTCLEHFKLLDQEKAGITTNMLDIVTSLQAAAKVINF